MADHELDAVADELVGDRNALLRIRHVVGRLHLELLAENAAGLVDILDRLLDTLSELSAEGGVRAGDRSRDPDLDLRLRRGRKQKGQCDWQRFEKEYLA